METPQPLHIYVHWPWCQSKCPYCDFNSHAVSHNGLSTTLRRDYIETLKREMTWWQPKLTASRPIASVFFGGGTPSLMQPDEIAEIIENLKGIGMWLPTTEVTLECNPASVAERVPQGYFPQLVNAGVNRVSIGVQGLRDEWLTFLGRHHSTRDAIDTLEAALDTPLRVNADVIYGIPEQSLDAWQQQLGQLAQMGLHHISAYQLTVEPNTAFWGQVQRQEWQPVDGDAEADFFAATRKVLAACGYENYEISNFSKPNEACRHNLGVWRGEDYLGIGAGAHGAMHLNNGTFVRTAIRKQPEAYLRTQPSVQNEAGFAQWFTPSPAQRVQDALFTGLRLAEGVALGTLKKTYGEAVVASAIDGQALALFKKQGWLNTSGKGHTEWICLTNTGWPLLSGLLRELLPRLNA